ncbi:hypothetical protein ACP70R_041421 [Stipagrostis hirtigluma subsp. patula]
MSLGGGGGGGAQDVALRPQPVKGVSGDDPGEEETLDRRRCLLERLMVSFGQQSRCISVKKAQISWSHRSYRRFSLARRCHTFPIALCRVVEHDQVEQVIHGSGEPGEPDRPGVLPGVREVAYYLLELSRKEIHREGSPVPLREVAVIRGLPGGCGISLTSHIDHLVVRSMTSASQWARLNRGFEEFMFFFSFYESTNF